MPVPLYHRELGGAGKPPLLLLHGLLGSSRNWQTAGADLAARFHVFALDLRNHGRSPHDDTMSYAAMVEDVTSWMDGRGMKAASLLGHSMGGKVAMLLAARFPERVEALWVVDIAPKTYLSAAHRAEFSAMLELDLRSLQSRAEAELRFEARVPDWGMRKFLTTNLERAQGTEGWQWTVNLPVLSRELLALEANSLSETDRFDGATHFVLGGKSAYVQPEDQVAIRHHFPAAQITVIASAGHNPHMDARAEFVKTVLGQGAGRRAPA